MNRNLKNQRIVLFLDIKVSFQAIRQKLSSERVSLKLPSKASISLIWEQTNSVSAPLGKSTSIPLPPRFNLDPKKLADDTLTANSHKFGCPTIQKTHPSLAVLSLSVV
jgi:hypothetical protein